MNAVGIRCVLWAAIVAVGWSWTSPLDAAVKTEKARAAAKLVEETLQREASEGIDDRVKLLEPAMQQKPPCEAAYWLSGFVFELKRKKWLSLEDVQTLAADDDRLAAYQKIRSNYPETEAGQTDLARWCMKRKLEDQARAHWTSVLSLAPDNAEARRQLGFQAVNGAWVNQQQIADAKAQFSRTQAGIQRWAPKLDALLKKLTAGNQRAREQARQELAAIKDPSVAPAIAAVFCTDDEETAMFGIELLRKLRSPQAAAVLSWFAVYAPWPQVGQAAAEALRDQEKRDYVPLLLDAAQQPPTSPQQPQLADSRSNPGNSNAAARPRMIYRLDENVSTYSWSTSERLKQHPYWWKIQGMRYNAKSPDPVAKKTTQTAKKGGDTSTVQKREYFTVRNGRIQDRRTDNKVTVKKQTMTPMGVYVPPQNSPTKPYQQPGETQPYSSEMMRTTPPQDVLAVATGEKDNHSLSDWWSWWYDHNEVYVPSNTRQSSPRQTDPQRTPSLTPGGDDVQAQRGDCLAAGTLVRTESGPLAIEKIAVGDRVFCCDPETGCLALKPVLRKTVRPEGKLVKIRAGDDEFQASGGHVFWVAGRGWLKARDLREGMRLHTIHGTVTVKAVESGASEATFSLVTADFHTFFAGKAMILTHDNTIRKPTACTVPGLVTRVAAATR